MQILGRISIFNLHMNYQVLKKENWRIKGLLLSLGANNLCLYRAKKTEVLMAINQKSTISLLCRLLSTEHIIKPSFREQNAHLYI